MTLLPPNASPLERGFEAATARLSALPTPLRDLWNPWTCPLAALPYLAWALSIDTWSSDWPEGVKRARVATAIEIQRHKGTAYSVRAVVKSFGGSLAIREWWETVPAGTPHSFAIMLSLGSVVAVEKSAAYTDAVIAEIRRTKPVRSHFTFTQAVSATGGMQAVAAVRPATLARLSLAAA